MNHVNFAVCSGVAAAPLRAAARETAVAKFDRRKGRAAWLQLLGELGVEIPG